jgi:hypothetical protein
MAVARVIPTDCEARVTDASIFSAVEQEQLVMAPVAVIAAMIGISPSNPVGVAQEIGAAVETFQQSAEKERDNPLIAGALVELKGHFDRYFQPKQAEGEETPGEGDIIALGKDPQLAIERCRAVTALIAGRASDTDALGYRTWLFTLAQRVAEAAKEGGFLGIGGDAVDAREQALLNEMKRALDL